jgi:hypothetical protein
MITFASGISNAVSPTLLSPITLQFGLVRNKFMNFLLSSSAVSPQRKGVGRPPCFERVTQYNSRATKSSLNKIIYKGGNGYLE